MRGIGKRIWKRYGGGPGELLASIACLALAAAAIIGWTQAPKLRDVVEWFIAAILLHDIVFVPVYTVADKLTLGWMPHRHAIYFRIPTIISLLVLATTFPGVFGYGARTTHNVSGIPEHGYFVRWLIFTGVLFGLSGLAWAMRSAPWGGTGEPVKPGSATG